MANIADIQRSLIATILADATVATKIGTRLYDLWRRGTTGTYPMAHIGLISQGEGTRAGLKFMTFQISVFTDNRDMLEASEIDKIIGDTINQRNLDMSADGWSCHWIDKMGANMIGIDDARICHVSSDYRVTISED